MSLLHVCISKYVSRFFLVTLFVICIIFISTPFVDKNSSLTFFESGYINVSVQDNRLLGKSVHHLSNVSHFSRKLSLNIQRNIFKETSAFKKSSSIKHNIEVFRSPRCEGPKTKVAFLKVHKAGSTTVMNIFLRFGDSKKLNIVLPKSTNQYVFNYLGYGVTIQKDRIHKIPANESYDILCNHAVYNKKVFQEILGPKVVNIGIIRDPFTHFPSAAVYFGLTKAVRKKLQIDLNEQHLISKYLTFPQMFGKGVHTHNGMFSDFGLPKNQFYNETAINQYLLNLDKDFALIMLTELFDESLVLMKRILCWDIKDILYIPLNINTRKKKNPIILPEYDKKNLFKHNYADFKLYLHFRKKLLRQIKDAGKDFSTEVKHFQKIHASTTKFCRNVRAKKFSGSDVLKFETSAWNDAFTVTTADCRFMMTPELDLLKKLIKKADDRYNNWWRNSYKPINDTKVSNVGKQ